MKKRIAVFVTAILFGTLTSCNTQNTQTPTNDLVDQPTSEAVVVEGQGPTATPEPLRVLNVCVGQEPASLFLYGDTTSAARSVLQAIYDGPLDVVDFQTQPVILERAPSPENGDVQFRPVEVSPGDLIIDSQGNWVSLQEGVNYRPSGCHAGDCALAFQGQGPVQMDALAVQFHLVPGIQWEDGEPLKASDSVYSFSVSQALFADLAPQALRFTQSYTALDELTVEWTGIPGYVSSYVSKFFSPLPEHLWSEIPYPDLLTSEISSRSPMGWGAYKIDEWTAGDHITLSRNPNYFRANEGLPHFDFLVYRFISTSTEAIDALLVGECDFIDRTAMLESQIPRLTEAQDAGDLVLSVQKGTAWELAAFGINTLDTQRPALLGQKEVRQAIAMCIDRQEIVDTLFFGVTDILDTYVPPTHPVHNPEARHYAVNREEATRLLELSGWLDADQNPETPRTSLSVPGVSDGTPLSLEYLAPNDGERPQVAEILRDGLAQCGIEVEIVPQDWEPLMMPGPEGSLFGRRFQMAEFAWQASFEPDCSLFLSEEIPGPLPDFPKGWGGANLTGFNNSEFDRFCHQANLALPGSEAYVSAHYQAQAIFAEELPAIPLYQHIRLTAMRPDLCGVKIDPAGNSALSHIEDFDYGENCPE